MESANLHHQHQLHQDQFVGSSSLSTPFYATAAHNSWNSSLLLNGGNLDLNVEDIVPPSINTSMIHELGYHWLGNATNFTNQSAHDLHLAKIKQELSEKFSENVNGGVGVSPNISEEFHLPSTSYTKQENRDLHDLNEKIFKTFASGCQLNEQQGAALYCNNSLSSASFGGMPASSREDFTRVFPSTNISNHNSQFLTSSGMNLQVLDLLTSTKFGGSYGQLPHNHLDLLKEAPSSSHWLTGNPNKISSFRNEVKDTKRSSSSTSTEPKASQTVSKKPRYESRSSLAPFKVRKEKLGDRIAALQQLVAPFGKTDTASVLMEAIGYIKFLQDQVETLSVPYMKTSRNAARRSIHEGTVEDGNEEPKRDLRSRGLCLVPLPCVSYIASDNVGGWPVPDFGGRS